MIKPSSTERFLKGRRLKGMEKTLQVKSPVSSVSKKGNHRRIKFKDGTIRVVTQKRLKTIMDQELTRKYPTKEDKPNAN